MRYQVRYWSKSLQKWLACEEYHYLLIEAAARCYDMQKRFPERDWVIIPCATNPKELTAINDASKCIFEEAL